MEPDLTREFGNLIFRPGWHLRDLINYAHDTML